MYECRKGIVLKVVSFGVFLCFFFFQLQKKERVIKMNKKPVRYHGKTIDIEKAPIEQLIKANKVVVFGSTYCGKSIEAYHLLQVYSDDVQFYELDNMKNGIRLREKLKVQYESDTIPAIFFNGRFMLGGLARMKLLIRGDLMEGELAKK